MKQVNIKIIENYLTTLPDSAADQVIMFVSYLNYVQDIDCEYTYPDERRVIDQYRDTPADLLDWDKV